MFFITKRKLKEYIELLEKHYAYLRENFELELEKRIRSYEKDAYCQLSAELKYWQEKAESLQRQVNSLTSEQQPCTQPS